MLSRGETATDDGPTSSSLVDQPSTSSSSIVSDTRMKAFPFNNSSGRKGKATQDKRTKTKRKKNCCKQKNC